MALKLITAPAALAVSLADVKTQLRIDGTDHDATLTAYIEAATQVAEHETGRRFITQTWEAVYDAFPCAAIELGLAPVQSVVSVKYLDTAGIEQTVSVVDYVLDADQSLGSASCCRALKPNGPPRPTASTPCACASSWAMVPARRPCRQTCASGSRWPCRRCSTAAARMRWTPCAATRCWTP